MEAPPHILDQPDPARRWLVAHARPRSEKKIAAYCDRQSVGYYLPLRARTHRYGGRRRSFTSPLFPGYVFCRADPLERSQLRQNRHVANLLEVADDDQLARQLRQIRTALEAGNVAEVLPYLQTGRPVRVGAGPLKGLEGLVVRLKGQERVVVNVDLIRRSVLVEVDSSDLAPV